VGDEKGRDDERGRTEGIEGGGVASVIERAGLSSSRFMDISKVSSPCVGEVRLRR
jgi:hypothetical protein